MTVLPRPLDQIEYWNGESGRRWVHHQETLDRSLEPLGLLAMDALNPQPGEIGIDIGCGTGATSLALATRVGTSGSVTGADISRPMLEHARTRAAGVTNLTFVEADASAHPFAPPADFIFSRFGVMFFPDTGKAFRNLFAALKPGGRLAFVCWQEPKHNPFMTVAGRAAAEIVPPAGPPDFEAPGPFRFGDPEKALAPLRAAGFQDAAAVPHTQMMTSAPDLDGAALFALEAGPASALIKDAAPSQIARMALAIRKAYEPYLTPNGVQLQGAVWRVTARKPAGA